MKSHTFSYGYKIFFDSLCTANMFSEGTDSLLISLRQHRDRFSILLSANVDKC